MCKQQKIFGTGMNFKISVELKLLIALRMLGRGVCADEVEEMSGVAESTCHFIFKKFIFNFASAFGPTYIRFPSGDKLQAVNKAYEKLGLPLCCGSMDVTHVRLGKCREGLKILTTGKEGFPTIAFQCVVGPNRECYYISQYFLGSYNDKTITYNCKLCQKIERGMLKNVEGILIDEHGIPTKCKGGYLIVDGGYNSLQFLINPFSVHAGVAETVWSE